MVRMPLASKTGCGCSDCCVVGGLVACCPLPPFSPPLPTQYNRSYDVQWMEQPVDHFNLLQPLAHDGQPARFMQRLLYSNKSWAGPGSPVIFYTGAEGSGTPAIWDHSGWLVEQLAAELGALFVMVE
jgi:hypothetical protein